MKIEFSDLDREDVRELLTEHLDAASGHEASHAYSLEQLRDMDVYLFDARNSDDELMGFAALKTLSDTHGEIKSVRTHPDHLRKGVSTQLMEHLADFASGAGLTRLSLETHPTEAYAAARAFYFKLGYEYCEPFGDYEDVETSVFMTREV